MLPAATVRALTIPAFTAAEFNPTQWASAQDKAKFANALMKFTAQEFRGGASRNRSTGA